MLIFLLYNEAAREASIPVGNTVLLKAYPPGRNKFQDMWSPVIYRIADKLLQDNVYVVQMVDGIGDMKTVTRTELLDLKKLQDIETEATKDTQEDEANNVQGSIPDSQILPESNDHSSDISSAIESDSGQVWVERETPSQKVGTPVKKPLDSGSENAMLGESLGQALRGGWVRLWAWC